MSGRRRGSPEPERTPDEEGFARRWSRLKREQGAVTLKADAEPPPPGPPELTDRDMPPVEELTPDSDFSPFLSPGVSESLRRLALRRLFHGEAFNVCDGLDDYAEDFSRCDALAGLVTSDMRHRMERLLQQDEAPAAEKGDRDSGTALEGDGPVADGRLAARSGPLPEAAAVPTAPGIDQDEVERT